MFFPNPKFINDEIANEPKEIAKIKKQIMGHWEGLSEYKIGSDGYKHIPDYGEHDTLISETVSVDIDSNIFQIRGIKEYENRKYLIYLWSAYSAQLWCILPDSIPGDTVQMNFQNTKLNIAPNKINSEIDLWLPSHDSMLCTFDLFHRMKLKRKIN